MAAGYGPKGVTGKWEGDKPPPGKGISQIQNFDDRQMQLYENQFSHLGADSYLSKLAMGDQSQFDQLEAPAFRQFNELQDNLASRFSGSGMGSRRSNSFQNANTAAASNFAENLQAQRMQLRQNAIKDLMGLSDTVLGQKPYDRQYYDKPQKNNQWGSIIGTGLGATGGFFLGGPAGALAGAQFGNSIGSGFDSGSSGGGSGANYGAATDLLSAYNKKWGGDSPSTSNNSLSGSLGNNRRALSGGTSGSYGLPSFGGY